MARSVELVVSEVASFAPGSEEENVHRLYALLENFRLHAGKDRMKALPAMFELLEKYPEGEFGSPGPLVHELEAIEGYQPLLQASLARQPTYLGTWMVNRILNSKLPPVERASWLSQLHAVVTHPRATRVAQEAARGFIQHQAGGNGDA